MQQHRPRPQLAEAIACWYSLTIVGSSYRLAWVLWCTSLTAGSPQEQAAAASRQLHAALPMGMQALALYQQLETQGLGETDFSSIYQVPPAHSACNPPCAPRPSNRPSSWRARKDCF